MCKVSVLIPVYNVEQYLTQCLDSLLAQTLQDIEFICINDGSTDDSLRILQEYAARDFRFKILNQKNGGYGKAMNAGLRAASGEYIGIVESDDFAEKDMFENLYDIALKKQADIVKSNFTSEKKSGSQWIQSQQGISYYEVLVPRRTGQKMFFCTPSIWSAIYKKVFLERYHIRFHETPGASYQDVSFFVETMVCADRVVLVPQGYLHYRMDNENSSVHSKEKVNCIFDEFEEIQHFLVKYPQFQQEMKPILSGLKGLHYIGNYRRIGQEYKKMFLDRMADEFQQEAAVACFEQTFWSDENWDFVQRLLTDWEHLYLEDFERWQKDRLLLRGFLEELQDMSAVYLYGAGKVGRQVLTALVLHGVKVDGFLVTSRGNNLEVIDGVSVKVLAEADLDMAQCMILISVAERMQEEILADLQEKGFHCLIMSMELRRLLAEY